MPPTRAIIEAPNPKIFRQNGEALAHHDLSFRARSAIEPGIQKELQAIDLNEATGPEKLLHDLNKYGFAILETDATAKHTISKTFNALESFLTTNSLSVKRQFGESNTEIDADYREPKKPIEGSRPFEHISGQRPFFFDSKYETRWPSSSAELKKLSIELIGLLEGVSQKVLKHISKLFGVQSDFFKDIAHESNQSTLRMIHCISDNEFASNQQAYVDANSKDDKRKGRPENDCVKIHTDWGLITLLPTATAEGLEFWFDDKENSDGRNSGWVELKSKPGQLILMPGNVSDIISRGKLRSIPHRVIRKGDQDRYSLAYFTEVKRGVNIDKLKDELQVPGVEPNAVSFYEQNVRPHLVDGHPITSDNYLMYLLEGKNWSPSDELIAAAAKLGLKLSRKEK